MKHLNKHMFEVNSITTMEGKQELDKPFNVAEDEMMTEAHKSSNHSLNILVCPSCNKIYSDFSRKHFEQHVKICGLQTYICEICNKKFANSTTLKRHFKIHLGISEFSCKLCGQKFRTKICLTEHEVTHQDQLQREANKVTCSYCDKKFAWKASLRKHLFTHTKSEEMIFICECGMAFSTYSRRTVHFRKCVVKQKNKQKKACIDNNALSFSLQQMVNLIADGSDENRTFPHTCQACKSGFDEREALDKHVESCDPFVIAYKECAEHVSKIALMKSLNKKLLHSQKLVKEEPTDKFRKFTVKSAQNLDKLVNEEINESKQNKLDSQNNTTPETADKTEFMIIADIKEEKGCDTDEAAHSKSNINETVNNTVPKAKFQRNLSQNISDHVGGIGTRSKRKRKLKTFEDYEMDVKLSFLNQIKPAIKCSRDTQEWLSNKNNSSFDDKYSTKMSKIQMEIDVENKMAIKNEQAVKFKLEKVVSKSPQMRKEEKVKSKSEVLREKVRFKSQMLGKEEKAECKSEVLGKEKKVRFKSQMLGKEEKAESKSKVLGKEKKLKNKLCNSEDMGTDNVKESDTSCNVLVHESTATTMKHKIKDEIMQDFDDSETDFDYDEAVEKRKTDSNKKPREPKTIRRIFFMLTDLLYKCTTSNCAKLFSTKKEFISHKLKEHREHAEYMCMECQKSFTSPPVLKSHLRMIHSELQSVQIAIKNCELYRTAVQNSIAVFACPLCGFTYDSNYHSEQHVCQPQVLMYYCPYCNLKYSTFTEVQEHLVMQHPFNIKCSIPDEKFKVLRNLEMDPASYVKDNELVCGRCGNEFETNEQLKMHVNSKHAKLPFCCGVCRVVYGRQQAIVQHLQGHKLQFQCSRCTKGFRSKSDLERHLWTHSTEKPCQCDICGTRYCDDKAVKKHIYSKHPDKYAECYLSQDSELPQSNQQVCEICGFCSNSHISFIRHLKTHDLNLNLKCTSCQRIFSRKYSLDKHICKDLQIDASKLSPPSDPIQLKKMFKSLRERELDHPSGKIMKCVLCHKRFRTTKLLNWHIKSIHFSDESKGHVCSVCRKGFPRSNQLTIHMRVHTGSRPYKCSLCPASFKQISQVKGHLKSHGQKNLQCQICGILFKTRPTLGHHVVVHCKNPPFKCFAKKCSQMFSKISHLIGHMRTCKTNSSCIIEDALPYQCYICLIMFNELEAALLHITTHERDELFKCEKCSSEFVSFKGLYFHKVEQKHFLESELQNFDNTFEINRKFTVAEAGNIDTASLLNQYAFVSNTNEFLQNDLQNSVQDTKLNIEVYGIVGTQDEANIDTHDLLMMQKYALQAQSAPDVSIQEVDETIFSQNKFYQTEDAGNEIENDCYHSDNTADIHIDTDRNSLTNIYDATVTDTHVAMENSILRDTHNTTDHFTPEDADKHISCDRDIQRDTYDNYSIPESRQTFDKNPVMSLNKVINKKSNKRIKDNVKISNHKNISDTATAAENYDSICIDPQRQDNTTVNEMVEVESVEANQFGNETHNEFSVNQQFEENDVKLVVNDSETTMQQDISDFPKQSQMPIKFFDENGKELLLYSLDGEGKQIPLHENRELLEVVLSGGIGTKVRLQFVNAIDEVCKDNFSVTKTSSLPKKRVGKNIKSERQLKNLAKVPGNIVCDEKSDDVVGNVNFKVCLNYYEDRTQEEKDYPFKCEHCDKRYRKVKYLNHHKKTHLPNNERKFQCTTCGAGFHVPHGLVQHQRIHTGEKPHACEHCHKRFRQLGHLQTHLRIHNKYYPFQCALCDSKFVTNALLKAHLKRKHCDDGNSELLKGLKKFKCDFCAMEFLDKKRWLSHQLQHIGTDAQKKLIDSFNEFASSQQMVQDNTAITFEGDEVQKSDEHICDICGNILGSMWSLKMHRSRHENSGTFKCPECQRSFSNNVLLKEHQKKHDTVKVVCEVCGVNILRKSIGQHMKRHRVQSDFQCTRCKKYCMRKSDFLAHVSSCMKDELVKKISENMLSQ